jgi:glycerol-3-phosphate acyltransferase PlsY
MSVLEYFDEDGVGLRAAVVIIVAYLLGSIPFGYLIVRATQGADVRETGSGGTGATNVSRRAGKTAGVVTLVLDALKGATAVVTAELIFGLPIWGAGGNTGSSLEAFGRQVGSSFQSNPEAYWWAAAAAIAVIVGHIFPVWLRFRGGKGVATGVGVFLMLTPLSVGLSVPVFVVAVVLTRYVSLGSMLATAAIPLFVSLENAFVRPIEPLAPLLSATVTGAAMIVFAHRENIGRLIRGTESKFW